MNATIIKADLVLPDRILVDGYLSYRDNVITAIDATMPDIGQSSIIDRSGHYLIPGLIDLQVNGGGGRLFNDATDSNDLRTIVDGHLAQGTTGLLATLMCDEPHHLTKQLALIAEATQRDAHLHDHILGIHLEGPFFSLNKRGMHAPHLIATPDIKLIQQWIDAAQGQIKIVTLAPELPGVLDVIHYLSERDIIVSLAHSEADYDQTMQAIAAGATMGTHLFNTMPMMAGRQPGLSGALLDSPSVITGIINDGVHVHDAMVRLALRSKGLDNVFFVSDAMHDVSGQENAIAYRGMTLSAKDGVCYNDAGALAGSAAPLRTALQRAVTHLDLDIVQAVRLCSTQPADIIGYSHRGRLDVGCSADVLICDESLQSLSFRP